MIGPIIDVQRDETEHDAERRTRRAGLYNMSRAQYEADPGVNWSSLKHMKRSPQHYRHRLLQQDRDTDARKRGRVFHLALFEPERFASSVAVWTGGRRYGKEWDAFRAANDGRELVTEAEHALCLAIQRAALGHPAAQRYLGGGRGEVSALWTHVAPAVGAVPGFSIDCKGRFDFVTKAGAIVDAKSTRDASPEGFGREVWRYGYHTQAAYYVDGHAAATGKRLPYVFVAVEAEPPHAVAVYRVPDVILDLGREEYRALLQRLALCRAESRWPGYFEGEADLELPRWSGIYDDEGSDLSGLGLTGPLAEEGA